MTKRTFTTPACPHCHLTSEVELESKDVERWQGGELIQNVWPEITSDQRELLMTGTHEGCWNEMWTAATEASLDFIDSLGQDIFMED